jgi:hypothetical protein
MDYQPANLFLEAKWGSVLHDGYWLDKGGI